MIYCQLYSGWRDLIVSHFQLAQAHWLAKLMSDFTVTIPMLSFDEKNRGREET